MRRFVGLIASVFLFMFYSCESNHEGLDSQDVERVSVMLGRMQDEDAGTRLATDDNVSGYFWELGDTLGIFPSFGGQVEFLINEQDAGSSLANFDGGGWALKGNHEYSAYYPFNFYNRNVRSVPFSYLGQEQTGNDNHDHLRDYLFFESAPVMPQNGGLTFTLTHAGSILKLELTMPVAKVWSTLSVYTDAEILPVKKTVDLKSVSLTQTILSRSDRISIGLKNVRTTAANQKIVVWLAFPSVSESSHPLKVSIKDSEGYVYVADVKKNDGTQAYASFTAHKYQRRYASPKLKEGMNSGISGWEQSGEDFGGTLN